ncbi:VPLPA-CTERM sorting domain-containing protein [Sulfuricaulis sp.]|jgi:hypothetical protein|uniref:VPLPA-CTERM sorting domain-containing protein n=1 Tax=Sulfuricaulis sp. TaxID=2003553 RepID=UPI003559DB46
MNKKLLGRLVLLAATAVTHSALAVYPTGSGTNYITTYDAAHYGNAGAITFNDWGYTGPNGSSVNDFVVPGTSGFDPNNIGQRQKVVTYGVSQNPTTGAVTDNLDWNTPDPAKRVQADDLSTFYNNSSMDGTVNFYRWAYTTPAGSTFNNMQIDKAGNYFVARNDMKFGFYDYFQYRDTTGVTPNQTSDTAINFQPYAISDARGWCGSVLNSNPNGVGMMAGQVTFDFAFDAYLGNGHPTPGAGGGTQIVPGFIMRSYGDYIVNMGSTLLTYRGSAVMNNTNPLTGDLDPNYQNKVSFLGGGVVPKGVWVTAGSYNLDGTRKLNADSTWQVTVASGTNLCDPAADKIRASDGAHCYQNSFAGYGFLMRADGTRLLYEINPTGHSNYVTTDPAAYASIAAVPVPAAVWLFGSGLFGLAGLLRRKHNLH